jgi:hypothetical protein
MMSYIDELKKGRAARGKDDLIKIAEGGRASPLRARHAYCYDCTGFYDDGVRDCENARCPLYQFMPYNPDKTKASAGGKGNMEALRKAREKRAAKRKT